jgi:hypothetical protein
MEHGSPLMIGLRGLSLCSRGGTLGAVVGRWWGLIWQASGARTVLVTSGPAAGGKVPALEIGW